MQEVQIAKALLSSRDNNPTFWHWLVPGKLLTRKDANKFLLGCILDYRVPAETAWRNAKRLAEEILGDPDDLWGTITVGSTEEWNAKFKKYSLHRFPQGHERVFRIGKQLVAQYDGDARNIWADQSLDAALYRLHDLRVGEQISRMIAGALIDAGILRGKGDVKSDVHVRRVLGRLLTGEEFTIDQAVDAARRMHPPNPWLLDRPLYRLGKSICVAVEPRCVECSLKKLRCYTRESR